ncbi:MAG TPA: helix-turn-helix domain-containing protein [Solirubrobacteraceae bacterium]|nr:helix-turn-helix domain-containing protein [Solirubrobacteraceae bacterium]
MPTFFERAFEEEAPVRLLDEDVDLFAGLSTRGQLEARARAIVPVIRLERGPWAVDMSEICDPDGCLGLLVLDGMLLHSLVVAQEPRSEIVGPGDVLRPWQQETELASVPFASEWDVVETARVAVLDERFLAFAARWPKLVAAVVERTVRRSHWLGLQLAITDLRRVDQRLLLFFWHLADRWGRVGPEGVAVPLPVTHDVLAQLVCAQRPTVTSALRRLTQNGQLRRRPDKTWLLAHDPPPVPAGVREHLGATPWLAQR